MSKVRFVGLDVHAETIAVAVAETGGAVRSIGAIPNKLKSIRKVIQKLGPVQHLRACYEDGIRLRSDRALAGTGQGRRPCEDRSADAEKLARCYRAGELTPVWVPDAAHEALRDLVRAREAAKSARARAETDGTSPTTPMSTPVIMPANRNVTRAHDVAATVDAVRVAAAVLQGEKFDGT